MTTLEAFAQHRTVAWYPSPPVGLPAALSGLAPLYAGSNGGSFWDGALVIRPLVAVDGAPLDVLAWNAEGLWRRQYPNLDTNLLFFAEDVFCVQYSTRKRGTSEKSPAASKPGARTLFPTLDYEQAPPNCEVGRSETVAWRWGNAYFQSDPSFSEATTTGITSWLRRT